MAREVKSKKGFYPVYCCGNLLCEAPANTSVKCCVCNRWQNVAGSQSEKLKGDQTT